MAVQLTLKITFDEAAHIEALLKEDMKQQEKWILAQQTTDEEKAEAQRRYAIDEKLLRQY